MLNMNLGSFNCSSIMMLSFLWLQTHFEEALSVRDRTIEATKLVSRTARHKSASEKMTRETIMKFSTRVSYQVRNYWHKFIFHAWLICFISIICACLIMISGIQFNNFYKTSMSIIFSSVVILDLIIYLYMVHCRWM